MRTALVLIDLQEDFLGSARLQPCRAALVSAAADLLALFRMARLPVVHVWTTIETQEQAMPHWRPHPPRCRRGSPGHVPPAALAPDPLESIHHKRGFNAFADGGLGLRLRDLGAERLVLAGVHLRTCLRSAAMEAHERGWPVWFAAEACGDDDPLHGAISRAWLEQRGLPFLPLAELQRRLMAAPASNAAGDRDARPHLGPDGSAPRSAGSTCSTGLQHRCPADPDRLLWTLTPPAAGEIAAAVARAREAQASWGGSPRTERRQVLQRLESALAEHHQELARQIAEHTGKPISLAALELRFAEQLVQASRSEASGADDQAEGDGWRARRCPLGVVAAITPWNNPVAIPLGKLAPALLHGNTVVWKPAIPALGLARRCLELLRMAGLPAGVVTLLEGDAHTAQALMEQAGVDAISLTGGAAAGLAAQIASCRHGLPLQAELGGNNAAIVWHDADLEAAAVAVAAGALEAAGQRCTANRRVIVEARIAQRFREGLQRAIEALPWGDPLDPASRIGPVISPQAARRLEALIGRAEQAGATVWRRDRAPALVSAGRCWVAPTLIEAAAPDSEIVQEESFGPILVLQQAHSWEEALELCNGVRQGLAAALFSRDPRRWLDFRRRARAGILRINASTAGASAGAPFGGWKQSGIGPAEHGRADIEFYSRWQTIYTPLPQSPPEP